MPSQDGTTLTSFLLHTDDFEPGKVELTLSLKDEAPTLGLNLLNLARQVSQGFYGEKAQLLIPMAISLSFGVVFATAITLLLVPSLYMILEDIKITSP